MPAPNPSLYEILLQNFNGELDLHLVAEQDQQVLSVLDSIQRILNSRAGTLAHLPDYGLPDMSDTLQGLPASAQKLINTMTHTLLKYEPRLAQISITLLPQRLPGHLDYTLDVKIKKGGTATFGSTLGPEGRVLIRHLKRQQLLPMA